MKSYKLWLTATMFFAALLFIACGDGGAKKEEKPIDVTDLTKGQPEVHGAEIKEGDIKLTTPLNDGMVADGQGIYGLKCQSCHKLTEEKLVGPGWKGVTIKRNPVWIMNMITNVEMMLEKDAEAQKLLELCMVRMPNQNVSKEDARSILEFMRSNDGVK